MSGDTILKERWTMDTKMDAQKALQILFQAARQAPLNGDSHDLVRQAAQVLQEMVTPKKKEEVKEEKK